MTPVATATLLTIALLLLALHLAPRPYKDVFANPVKKQSLSDRIQRNLSLAGFFDKTPTFVLGGLLAATTTLSIVAYIAIGLWGIPLVIVGIPAGFHFYLMQRQRTFMKRATEELVPFLNRMATSVKAGRPAQSAYINAVYESKELRTVLGDSAAKISAGVPFREALVQTIPLLPIRMWSVFVRQLEAHDEMGGNLGDAIQQTVKQVNKILQLQAEARADYAAQNQQQKIIAIIAFGGTAAFGLTVDISIISVLWTTVVGVVMLIISLSIMFFGLWLSRKQLRDFEKEANL